MKLSRQQAAAIAKDLLAQTLRGRESDVSMGTEYRLVSAYDLQRRVWEFAVCPMSEAEFMRHLALQKMKAGLRDEAMHLLAQCNQDFGPPKFGGGDVGSEPPLALIEVDDATATGRVVSWKGEAV